MRNEFQFEHKWNDLVTLTVAASYEIGNDSGPERPSNDYVYAVEVDLYYFDRGVQENVTEFVKAIEPQVFIEILSKAKRRAESDAFD
jgi:hypothetical protein